MLKNTNGDAVVEATILFPIMIMIFAALVLLSIFLPAQAVLQRATQFTAIALATEKSDTWLVFDDDTLSLTWETDKSRLRNVYADLFYSADIADRAENITREVESRSISSKEGQLSVSAYVENKILYREVVVEATREYPMPVDLSLIGFPRTITIRATSSAVAQNASEFIRNMDIASDFATFIIEKYELQDITDAISSFGAKVTSLLGWNS
ncbi:MAG: pilus assembly protein [Oscillospiraceae bacterium]|nr:pilus assembly protein [Oscillospiraceae bacterium]MCL2278881.1 pilus assembly protein [Oscillospiraceae bacterium]